MNITELKKVASRGQLIQHRRSILSDWWDSASGIRPLWRQRKHWRDTITDDILSAAEDTNDADLSKWLDRLFFHPYYSFEPRTDNDSEGDQQTAYYESQALNTVACGGNGSGKTYLAAQRLIKFLCEDRPPPKRNTPFWVIGDTYEEVCSSCWDQKIADMIPEEFVDWNRISWKNQNRNWPLSVPLKPWPGHEGRNWVIEFKSYEQGRSSMQARAIGGAWFTEQFPWEIYLEVFRGIREYAFPGSVWMEFTPIDPAKSFDVERQYESWLGGDAPSWEFYRLSTESAAKAGQVDRDWFDSFSAILSADEKETRLRGAFGSYLGQIYKDFDPRSHLITWPEFLEAFGGEIPMRGAVQHKRSFDWGAGEENAFAAHWGMKDAAGTWWIYDEYYTNNQSLTIEDHCNEIAGRHPWPNDPWHRESYGDPASPIWFREFAKNGIPVTRGKNAVESGIDCIKRLLKKRKVTNDPNEAGEPRIYIVKDRCPNLARQMQTYRWERSSGKGTNPRDARPIPLKKDDHACFVAGTLVTTPSGEVPIETIYPGDIVQSHLGWTTVLLSQQTGIFDTLVIASNDGGQVECTSNHPFGITGGEWMPAGSLKGKRADRWSQFPNEKPTGEIASPSHPMADMNGEDTPILHITACGSTFVGPREKTENFATSGCINRYTKTTMGQFRKAWPCTTSTGTREITIRRILNCKSHQTIPESISRISLKLAMRQKNGTPAKRGLIGTEKMESRHFKSESQSRSHAKCANQNSRRRTGSQQLGFAPINAAMTQGSSLASITNSGHAQYAEANSPSTVTHRRKLARQNVTPSIVVSVRPSGGPKPVYNLATEDGTYFANRFLVSNCDSLRYLVYTDFCDSIGGATTVTTGPPKPESVPFKRVGG